LLKKWLKKGKGEKKFSSSFPFFQNAYSTLSFSIKINKAAIATPGKKIPKIGTRIEGK
jgi:hypothetical protein